MKAKPNWTRAIYIIGVIALIAGIIDPLEGSIIIVAGSTLLALATCLKRDRHWNIFLSAFLLIAFGVAMMFYLSSLGGFGGKSKLSWWWGLLILPYPIGWLMSIVLLIIRLSKKSSKQPLDQK